AKAMGASGFDYESVRDIAQGVTDDQLPPVTNRSPRDSLKDLPTRFRGHYITDTVVELERLGLPVTVREPTTDVTTEGFLVLEKEEIVPNFYLLEIEAPQVARFARPGQFVIVMVNETSERVPFTLADWDEETSVITLIVEEVGRSSREVAMLKKGGRIAHVTGPLGMPLDIKNFGTVVLGAGCYGIGAIYPIARAMKEAGNRVISVIEACSDYLMYWEDKFRKVSDEVIFATKDGSRGVHGGVQDVFRHLMDNGVPVDVFVAIGCTFMMRMAVEVTRSFPIRSFGDSEPALSVTKGRFKATGVPTYVALNPIMVDGTGMCGACRCTVGGEARFACIDGPIFNGHEVDWDELASRRGAYANVEIEALSYGGMSKGANEE
ncbi:MAG: sulfide/dihydroorotate dehydrogenase-like FAD/NAD-binding protein, partial [Bacteroidota bacterium]